MHPIIDVKAQADVLDILRSGELTGFKANPDGYYGGKFVQQLEQAFRVRFGVKYAITLNSATAALHAALIASGVRSGDEVIVTPYSFSASASCVLMSGAKPVFVDIEDETFNINPKLIERAITPKTEAIIPVHLCGHPAAMQEIMELAQLYNLTVIEDAAQSIGAKYKGEPTGTIGDCGIFSFNQSKHISTGEGGMLITDDDKIAEIVMAVRNHGEVSAPDLKILGYNYRMSEIEAALALSQLETLDEMTAHRVRLTSLVSDGLKNVPGLTPPVVKPDCTHVWYTYPLKVKNKHAVLKKLKDKGIYFGEYVKPLHLLPIYNQKEGLCPVAERMWREELIVTDRFRYPLKDSEIYVIIQGVKDSLTIE